MKNKLLSLGLLALPVLGFSQYTQNFDALQVGDYIAVKDAQWTTWSGNTGGTEDAQVNSQKSNSPNHSLYFNSTSSNGGPQDVVLEFGAEHNTGTLTFEQALYIETGRGAYFNFQADQTIGQSWALNASFNEDSMMLIYDDQTAFYEGKFSPGTWFDFKLVANLNVNSWEVFIDNVSIGVFQMTDNRLASLNLYPINNYGNNNLSRYWVDDVYYNHVPYTLPTKNAGVYRIDVNPNPINGTDVTPSVTVRNLGTTAITSFDITVDYNGTQVSQSVTGVNIPSLGTHDVSLPSGFTISNADTSFLATVSNVNGPGGDDDPNDDDKTVYINVFNPEPGKVVVVEEGTGSWCGWCPRGTVAMEYLARDYKGFAAGIAVHNGDPMVHTAYDNGIGALISGYPSALVDRGSAMDPSGIFGPVTQSLLVPPTAVMTNGARYNPTTGAFEVSISAAFQDAANQNWKVACVLTEDDVTGTGSGWSQTNYYAGGAQGDLIDPNGVNWANLPSSVPASQMPYNHVARSIAPGFNGQPNSFPTSVASGDTHTVHFSFVMDPSWDTSKMHVIGILLKPNGEVDNGSTVTISEAIANGYVGAGPISIGENLIGPDVRVKLYPNPASHFAILYVDGNFEEVKVSILDLGGKEVNNLSLGHVDHGELTLPLDNLSKGVYLVHLDLDGYKEVHRLVVK